MLSTPDPEYDAAIDAAKATSDPVRAYESIP